MAYEPKTWECGDVVTADALNNIEQGIADAQLPSVTASDNGKVLGVDGGEYKLVEQSKGAVRIVEVTTDDVVAVADASNKASWADILANAIRRNIGVVSSSEGQGEYLFTTSADNKQMFLSPMVYYTGSQKSVNWIFHTLVYWMGNDTSAPMGITSITDLSAIEYFGSISNSSDNTQNITINGTRYTITSLNANTHKALA